MKSITLRRLGAAVIAPALAAGMVVAAPSAQAAPNVNETAAATWLAAQPGGDDLFTSYYADFGTGDPVSFVDYGLNLDLYTALTRLGATAKAEAVYDATVEHADEYTDSFGTRYAGAVGKLAATVQAHGDDASDLGGRDLIADLEALLVTSGDEAGRAKDSPDSEFQSTNILNQGWVVRALANADSADATLATDFLLKQQCNDGSFREDVAATPCTTDPGSVDGTAFSILSLAVAAKAGVAGLQDDIDDAAAWLVSSQGADGSFADAGAVNTNSTGLAASALVATSHPTEANAAAVWIAGRQVTVAPEAGAIALNDADVSAAQGSAIADLDRDRYVRASVQAALGLSALLPATFAAAPPAGYVRAGSATTLTATGLVPGEKFTASVAGGSTVRGTADASGRATAVITAPATSGTRSFTVVGSTPARQGAANVTVLAARKLPTTIRSKKLRKKARQQVVVKGLQPGEPFQIRYRGKQIKTGKANSKGRVIHSFSVGGSKGRKSVNVYGLFTGRKGTKSFTVK